ncbi:MAG: glycosyltransferase [Deltaproteobacteria bacterium]|nr:glycosyltransferase [Deltaproteobacteria bacterium]
MNKPTLSVTISNYNDGKYIKKKLESLLNQSYPPDEIIIIDDGSTDDSVSIINELARDNPTIHLHRNDRNEGVMEAAKRMFKLTRGDYIYSASSNDLVKPTFLEKSMNLLIKYPEAGLCCSNSVTLDESTGLTSQNDFGVEAPRYFSPEELVQQMKKRWFWIAGHTSIIKRSSLVEAKEFRPELKWHGDWFLLHVIAFRHGICYTPELLAIWKTSSNSYSARPRSRTERRLVYKKLFDLILSESHKDVRKNFKESGILSTFSYSALSVALSRIRYLKLTSLHFWKVCLLDTARIIIIVIVKKIPGARFFYRKFKK